jgi:DNA polymerase II
LTVWVKHGSRVGKRHVPYQPSLLLRPEVQDLEATQRLALEDARVAAVARERRVLWLGGEPEEVLRVQPRRLQDLWGVARDLRRAAQTVGHLAFDVDEQAESRWMHEHGLFSMCRLAVGPQGPELRRAPDEDRWSLDYPDPGLRTVWLEVRARQQAHEPRYDDPLESVRLGATTLTCTRPGHAPSERDVLLRLGRLLTRHDPDVIYTRHGDRWDIPFLLRRIRALGLVDQVRLGRDRDPDPEHPDQAAQSIQTYGRWLHKTHAYYLRGRWHLDLSKKTLDGDEERVDLHGILYMARVGNRRVQDTNRNGAGYALQQMQVDAARDQGVALPWKRNLTEDWKDLPTLCAVDRGGQIVNPRPGLYEDVAACDFSGYYPSIVVRHNLSSDTINCACCPDGPLVPELGYHVCTRKVGHQAGVLAPLLVHRRRIKAVLRRAEAFGDVPEATVAKYRAIKSEIKALCVVCFGYMRYRNARFGCAEVHQAIQCFGRAGMTQAREVAQALGFDMIHSMTDCVFLHKPGLTRADALHVARRISFEVGVPMDVEGVYRWLVLLPSKTHSTEAEDVGVPTRYYGLFEDGRLKVRGIEVQRHSTPAFVYDVQQGMLDVFAQAQNALEFRRRIPQALAVAKAAAERLRRHEVPPEDAGVLVQATRSVEEYAAMTGTRQALRALRDAGTERRPGEYVKYVVTRRKGPWPGRARPVELLRAPSLYGDLPVRYDVEAGLRLLARSVETMLAPFGYTEERLFVWLQGSADSPTPPAARNLPRPARRAFRILP